MVGQPVDLNVKVELVDDIAGRLGEPGYVAAQIPGQVVRVAQQGLECVLGDVVERFSRGVLQYRTLVLQGLGKRGGGRQDLVFGGLQNTIQPTQHRQRQDDPAIFGLLVHAPQQIGHRPDEGTVIVGRFFAHLVTPPTTAN